MTTKVMISLPDQLFKRMKAIIPERQRSKIIANLIKKELAERESHLYQKALSLERSKTLKKDILNLDTNLSGDGLDEI